MGRYSFNTRRKLLESLAGKKLVRPEGYVLYFVGDTAFPCELKAASGYYYTPTISFEEEYLELSYETTNTSDKPTIMFMVDNDNLGEYAYLTIIYKTNPWQSSTSIIMDFGNFNTSYARTQLPKSLDEWNTVTLANPNYGVTTSSSAGAQGWPVIKFGAVTDSDVSAVFTNPDGSFNYGATVKRHMLIQALYLHN